MPPVSRSVIAVAIVQRGDYFLVGQRPAGGALAGYAEFPGGKVEPGETIFAAAQRECREEAGLVVRSEYELLCVEHDYQHARLELHFVACSVSAGDEQPLTPFHWVARIELERLTFPPANTELIRRLTHG